MELSVNAILDACLSETGFTYEVDGNLILIKEAREQTLPQKVEKIEVFQCYLMGFRMYYCW